MKYLISGGEGFIGRYLKDKLLKEGHEVKTLDIAGDPDFKISILDYDSLSEIMHGLDGVFHLAAITSPPQFEDDMISGFNTNVYGTLNILRAAAINNVKRVVLASSSAVYGDIAFAGKEDLKIPGHKNMYATTKLFDEYLAQYYHLRSELEVVSLRYFNAYGVGENVKGMYASVFTQFLRSISEGKNPVVYGDGTQSRDFIYVKDLAAATYLAMTRGKSGEVYNIGTGKSISFNSIISEMSNVLGKKIVPEYTANPFKNYQMFTLADPSKAKEELSWEPEYGVRDGIREIARSQGLKA